jgi:aminopeptidase N
MTDAFVPDPRGVTHARAIERAARLSNVACALTLRIPEDAAAGIQGRMATSFLLASAHLPLIVDFAREVDELMALTVNGRAADVPVTNGHLIVPPALLVDGPNTIACDFVAGVRGLHRQDDLVYSLFVPDRASSVFPCFDQPDIRTRWTLTLEIPTGWRAVANGRDTSHAAADTHEMFVFAETPPLPTYLLAFAAGRFSVDVVECAAREFRVFHREADAARFERNGEGIVRQHAQAIAWLESYTGVAYPFDSFDIILIPSFQFGGMEHPGAVYYNADLLLLDASATQLQDLGRANVIAHETAHMWFGNLVTMTWFDDVWLKEVFANFMAARIVNPSYPEMDHDLRFLVQHYPPAYDVDRTDGAHPIRQSLDTLADAGSLYGPIIYMKAPIVLRQLELLMGEGALQAGLREYLRTYAYGNAAWPDLLTVLGRFTPHDLARWSHAWIEAAGRPTLTIERESDNHGGAAMVLRQDDPSGRGLVWPQRARVVCGAGGTTQSVDVTMEGASAPVVLPAGTPAPDWALPSGGGLAYGLVVLDPGTVAYLTRPMHLPDDPLTRAAALITLWEAMLDGQLPPGGLFVTLLEAIEVETDELVLQLLLDQARTTFWRFTHVRERAGAAERLERVLHAGMARAGSTSARAALFTTLRSVALTPACVEWLEAVWSRVRQVDGLPLSDVDEAALALDLSIRMPDRAGAIITTQIARTVDPDRRARLAFIAPAVSADAATRTAFFEGLAAPARRAREAWVLDAMRCLHHPLRASESSHLVRPALGLVQEIQRTGDIFFPKRWADATLSGHQSQAVADDVRLFIDGLSANYPRRLRGMLLAAADPLFRAARLLQG